MTCNPETLSGTECDDAVLPGSVTVADTGALFTTFG
jgi:hypothetical protein